MIRSIKLLFDHPPCGGIRVDVSLPLPGPITEGAETTAGRVRPACPIFKASMQYVGFLSEDPEIEPNRHDHAPLIARDITRILGCTCGWRTPPGTADSDEAIARHFAWVFAAEG